MENEIHNEVTTEVNDDTPKTDVIGELFVERDRGTSERSRPRSEKEPEDSPIRSTKDSSAKDALPGKDKKEKLTVQVKTEGAETENSDTETAEEENETTAELQRLRADLEKTRKRLLENQSFGRQSAQKLKMVSKSVQALMDNGSLTTEEAQGLLKTLHAETEEEDETVEVSQSNPFASLFQIANKELEHIRKYTEDDLLQEKIEAFDFLLSVSSQEEVEEILETLAGVEADPVKLTRKMLSLGQETYEKSYKVIKQAGGLKSYLAIQHEEIEKLTKKIDKLEKKLSHYEDYDTPRYRISGMSDITEKSSQRDTIGSLFAERDRPRQVTR
jgi:hypothetical protein